MFYALRGRLGLTGTKKGCNQGACGAGTVLHENRETPVKRDLDSSGLIPPTMPEEARLTDEQWELVRPPAAASAAFTVQRYTHHYGTLAGRTARAMGGILPEG